MAKASSADDPHISPAGCKAEQTAGRSGLPNNLHRKLPSNCTHGTPAGLPWGMPGIGEEMETAIQQAAHPLRHSMELASSRLVTLYAHDNIRVGGEEYAGVSW